MVMCFIRLSLQYHPDKNKNKGAQEKFAEINNGTILSSLLSSTNSKNSPATVQYENRETVFFRSRRCFGGVGKDSWRCKK